MHKKYTILFVTFVGAILVGCTPNESQVQTLPAEATEIPKLLTATQSQTASPSPAIEASSTATETSPLATSTMVAPTAEIPLSGISFANDVMPIFNSSCIKCHGTEQIKEGLDMRTYESIMAGSFNGSVLTPGKADESFLVQQILDGEMPKRGQKLTPLQIQVIIDWVNAGAINN